MLGEALALAPGWPRALVQRSIARLKLGRLEGAAADCQAAGAGHGALCEALGLCCADRRRWGPACRWLERAVELGRSGDAALWALGWCRYRLNRLADCLGPWRQLLERHPENGGLAGRVRQVEYLVGLRLAAGGDCAKAIPAWTACLADPDLAPLAGRNLAEAHFRCAGVALHSDPQDLQGVVQAHLDAACSLLPQETRPAYYRALLESRRCCLAGDWEAAEAAWGRMPAGAAQDPWTAKARAARAAISGCDPGSEAACRLRARLLLERAAGQASRGEWGAAAQALLGALKLEPGLVWRLEQASAAAAAVAAVLLLAGHRPPALELCRRVQSADIAARAVTHLLVVAHYWAAVRYSRNGQRTEALNAWRQLIPNAGLLVHDETFWRSWCAARAARYDLALGSADMAQFRQAVEQNLLNGLSLASPAGMDLRVELGAARGLASIGGMTAAGFRVPLVCGPVMMRQLRCTQPFSGFIAGRLEAADGAPDPALSRVMRYYSRLSEAQARLEYDRPEDALRALESACCQRCGLLLSKETDDVWAPRVCRPECEQFGFRNPAYAQLPDRGQRLRREAAELAAEAHLAISDRPALPDAQVLGAWREALRLAPDKAGQAVGERATSLCERLLEEEQFDGVVRLAEGALELTGAQWRDELNGSLARALRRRAVLRSRADDPDWQAVLADCRRSVQLNPHVLPALSDLVTALRNLAHELLFEDRCRAEDLFGEAARTLDTAVAEFPDDQELKKYREKLERERRFLEDMD